MYGKEGTHQICVTDILTEPGSLQLKAGCYNYSFAYDRWMACMGVSLREFEVIFTQ